MAGRIVVESPGLETAWGGEPFRRDAQPARAQWDRFRLDFADGGSLVLFDKRRLSRVRLNPGLAALGPDAGTVTEAEFRDLVRRGTVAVKARLLDQSKIAGVGNLLADEALWQARISPQAPAGSLSRPAVSPAVPVAAGRTGVRRGERRGAHRRGHRGPAAWRRLPALRRPDAPGRGRRPDHLVVLPRAGPAPRCWRAGPGACHCVTKLRSGVRSRYPCEAEARWVATFS